ncbi:hypothetical protein AMECASPLE_003714, partial [Ameca splendens]
MASPIVVGPESEEGYVGILCAAVDVSGGISLWRIQQFLLDSRFQLLQSGTVCEKSFWRGAERGRCCN